MMQRRRFVITGARPYLVDSGESQPIRVSHLRCLELNGRQIAQTPMEPLRVVPRVDESFKVHFRFFVTSIVLQAHRARVSTS